MVCSISFPRRLLIFDTSTFNNYVALALVGYRLPQILATSTNWHTQLQHNND